MKFNIGTLAVAALLLGVPLGCVVHDPTLSAEKTATALQMRLGTAYRFHCTPSGNDGTIELDDVDYICEPDRASGSGYWVGTDDSKITELQPMG